MQVSTRHYWFVFLNQCTNSPELFKHILPHSLCVFHVLLQCVHKTYTTILAVCVPCIVTMCPQNIYYHIHCLCSMYCYNVSTKHILPYSLSVFHVLLQCVRKHILPYSLSVFIVLLQCVHKTYTTILTVCVPCIVTMCPKTYTNILTVCVPSIATMCPQNIYYHTHCLCSMYCYNVSTKHILPYPLSVFHLLLQCVHKTYTTILTVGVPCIVTMCPQNIYYHTHCLCSMYRIVTMCYTHCLCSMYCYNVSTKHILPYSLSVFHVLLHCVHGTLLVIEANR